LFQVLSFAKNELQHPFKMDRKISRTFDWYWVNCIISIQELNYFLAWWSNTVIICNSEILNAFDKSSLHISSISSFNSGINQPFSPSASMEEKFDGVHSWVKWILDKSFSSRFFWMLWEVRKSSILKSIWNSFATHNLLTYKSNHLAQILNISFGSTTSHNDRAIMSGKQHN